MTVIDVVFKNGVFKPLKKIEPKEGEIIEVRVTKVATISKETSGKFKGKYNKKMRYEMYDIR